MTKQRIEIGDYANDRAGDSLREAFRKVNENFTELYTALGLDVAPLNLGAFEFTGSVMSTTDSTPIVIDQATTITSDLTVGGDILPSINLGGNLGSPTRQFKSLYVSTNTIYINNVPLSLDGSNNILVNNAPISTAIEYTSIPDAPTDVADLTDLTGLLAGGGGSFDGSTAAITLTGKIPYVVPVFDEPPVVFTRPNNSPNTIDAIDTGVAFKRANQGALYNSAGNVETSWNSNVSPLGTEWNADGWGDLADVKTRTYTNFTDTVQLDTWLAAGIHHKELVMHDTINDKYYTFKFFWWQANGGGGSGDGVDQKSGFSYARQLIITDPSVVFVHPAGDANANQDDVGANLSITRGADGGGIYNAAEENAWDADVSPYGTLWNDEGWDDFEDITTRTWKPFFAATHGRLGNEILGRELLMKDTHNNKYYVVKFLEWGDGNGGSFSYWRREVSATGTKLGITFADGSKQLTANTLGNLKVSGGNVIYNAEQPGHGAEIRSDVKDNHTWGTYWWTGDANWVVQGSEGYIQFDTSDPGKINFPNFLSDLGRFETVTVSINGSDPIEVTDSGTSELLTKVPPATDPTLVTELVFYTMFRSRMYMGGQNTVGFFLNKESENFRVQSSNIDLNAGDRRYGGSVYISGWGSVELRNNSSTNGVSLVADADESSKTWSFMPDGSIGFPYLYLRDRDNNSISGQTLQVGNYPYDDRAIITGPSATTDAQAARPLIIQAQPGWRGAATQATGAEGGDVYIYAGYGGEGNSFTGPGGDIELRGGNGGAEGGNILIESGLAYNVNAAGGSLTLNAGSANGGSSGYETAAGGDVTINAGQGYGAGGSVNINAGEGQTTDGSVYINTVGGDYTWTFGTDGYLTMSSLELQGYLKGVDGSTGSTGQVLTRQSNGGVAWANATGGTVDRLVNGDFNFILGPDGTVNFDPSSANGKGILQTAADLQFIAVDKTWTFGADGVTRFPNDKIKSPVGNNLSIETEILPTEPPATIVISGADFTAVNLTYIKDGANSIWYPAGYNPANDPYIEFTSGQYEIFVPGFNQALYVNTGTLNVPLAQWNTNPPLGSVAPTGVYTYPNTYTRAWQFGTDGRTTFPNGTVPEHSYGAAGDKEGMVVFSDPYIYYCKQDYVDNTTDIWVRVAWTGTNW